MKCNICNVKYNVYVIYTGCVKMSVHYFILITVQDTQKNNLVYKAQYKISKIRCYDTLRFIFRIQLVFS